MRKFKYLLLFLFSSFYQPIYCQEALPLGSDASHMIKKIEEQEAARLGTQLPTFVADALNGDVFSNLNTTSVVFYYIWYNCGDPCYTTFPMFNEIQEEFNGKVDFIAISYQSKPELQETLKEYPLNFKHVVIEKQQLDLFRLAISYPCTLITVDNTVVYYKTGGLVSKQYLTSSREEFRALFRKYLE